MFCDVAESDPGVCFTAAPLCRMGLVLMACLLALAEDLSQVIKMVRYPVTSSDIVGSPGHQSHTTNPQVV